MPELVVAFSMKEVRRAHAWARDMGLSCKTRRQRSALHMSGRGFNGEVGAVRVPGDILAVIVAGGSDAGVRHFHIGGTLEEALLDLEAFIYNIRGDGNGD